MAQTVHIIYNKTNTYGLHDDVLVIERLLRTLKMGKPKLVDMREPCTMCDLQIHLEIPVFGAIPWARRNIILVNPEQWSYAYDTYVHAFDVLLFRYPVSAEHFRADFIKKGLPTAGIQVLPWCDSWATINTQSALSKPEFVCFLAGSLSKYTYLASIISKWTVQDPPLTVYTTRQDFAQQLSDMNLPCTITVICQELNEEERRRIMYQGHLICSQGEAFGYAAAHAESVGAFSIMNRLPAFESTYADASTIAWLSNDYQLSDKVRYHIASPTESIRSELDQAFAKFAKFLQVQEVKHDRKVIAAARFAALCDAFRPVLLSIKNQGPPLPVCPPILEISDCPFISIITPTYNRKKLIDIAFHNLLATDYPHNKIEWIVIEDSDTKPSDTIPSDTIPISTQTTMASEKIIEFQIQAPNISIKYIPIEGRMSIGEKRNHAIENSAHDFILFMDDDDHYPSTSFRRRVAWLTKGVKRSATATTNNIACCTTLALYDLNRGTSAVNVPPFDIPFAQRISEATLTFRKSAWLERKFPHVSISEGEDWIQGREDQVIEMPPQQIIVAFSHGTNQTRNRVPPTNQPPSCFWGFPKEYLIFIHGLIDVHVE